MDETAGGEAAQSLQVDEVDKQQVEYILLHSAPAIISIVNELPKHTFLSLDSSLPIMPIHWTD